MERVKRSNLRSILRIWWFQVSIAIIFLLFLSSSVGGIRRWRWTEQKKIQLSYFERMLWWYQQYTFSFLSSLVSLFCLLKNVHTDVLKILKKRQEKNLNEKKWISIASYILYKWNKPSPLALDFISNRNTSVLILLFSVLTLSLFKLVLSEHKNCTSGNFKKNVMSEYTSI